MQEFQQRVVAESVELDAKRVKLVKFLDSDRGLALPEAEQQRLQYQYAAMTLYSRILSDRIAAFS